MDEGAGIQDWRETARRARALLGDPVGHGHKTARLADLAASLGLTRGTLDNYLRALAALERLEAGMPHIARKLDGQSAAAIAALGRWADDDPRGLERFLDDHPKPRLRQVLGAERLARLSPGRVPVSAFDAVIEESRATPPQEREPLLWSGPQPPIAGALEPLGLLHMRLLDFDWSGAVPPYAEAVGLTRLGRLHQQDDKRRHSIGTRFPAWAGEGDMPILGLIEIAARDRAEQYRREARGLWLRMVAASTLTPVVIALFPDAAAREASAGNLPSSPDGWHGREQGELHPWMRRLNGWGGVALLTTLDTLFVDWAGTEPANPYG